MLKRISHTFIHVLDQDEALDFYVGKLGMVVHTDADLGTMRNPAQSLLPVPGLLALFARAAWPVRFCRRAQGPTEQLVQRCDDRCRT